jgi:hypothetical protein
MALVEMREKVAALHRGPGRGRCAISMCRRAGHAGSRAAGRWGSENSTMPTRRRRSRAQESRGAARGQPSAQDRGRSSVTPMHAPSAPGLRCTGRSWGLQAASAASGRRSTFPARDRHRSVGLRR